MERFEPNNLIILIMTLKVLSEIVFNNIIGHFY